MRIIPVIVLTAALCVVACRCAVATATQPPKAKKAVATQAPAEPKKPATWTVEGWGKDEKSAEKRAAEKAREKVIGYLQSLDPPLLLTLSVEEVRRQFMNSKAQPCPDQKPEIVNGEEVKCWSWTVTVTAEQLASLRRDDERARIRLAVEQRKPIAAARGEELAKLVGWLVLALAGVWAYVRVDEWTKGAQRPWLRIALASVVASGGVGWWLLS
jgi:hypothetical protein